MAAPYLAYHRSKFKTRLPKDCLFTEGHFWLAPTAEGTMRIGFTQFATRMLGEVVEFEFEVKTGEGIDQGQAIGWVEGFKAITDLYSPMAGRFAGPNPDLVDATDDIHRFPYDRGWLYGVEGVLPDGCMSPEEYAGFLDGTIDRMLGQGP